MNKWVQHKNDPNGRKWEVISTYGEGFNVADRVTGSSHRLPRDEYVIVDPPEEWEDVTGLCSVSGLELSEKVMQRMNMSRDLMIGKKSIIDSSKDIDVMQSSFYRVTKVDGLHNGPAFIVERRKP